MDTEDPYDDHIHKLALECYIARILLEQSRRCIEPSQRNSYDTSVTGLARFITNKLKKHLRPYAIRGLIKYGLVTEALDVAREDADTIILLETSLEPQKRLIFRTEKYASLGEKIGQSKCSNLQDVIFSDQNIKNLERRCTSLLIRTQLDDAHRVWKSYIRFYRKYLGSNEALQSHLLELIEAETCQVSIGLFKTLEIDEATEGALVNIFPDRFLMRLLVRTVAIQAEADETSFEPYMNSPDLEGIDSSND